MNEAQRPINHSANCATAWGPSRQAPRSGCILAVIKVFPLQTVLAAVVKVGTTKGPPRQPPPGLDAFWHRALAYGISLFACCCELTQHAWLSLFYMTRKCSEGVSCSSW